MNVDTMKVEVESEACCICSASGEELYSPEEHDAGAPPSQPPLRTMLLHLNNSKILPSGRLCNTCIHKTIDAYNFSKMLSSTGPPPLSDKIRALRKRLQELTQKIDVFIVVGGNGANGPYSEEDIIMVERDALAAATRADAAELARARNTRGDDGYQCNVCPAFFQRAAEYRAHAQSHGEDAPLSCWSCGAQFPAGADKELSEHEREHHADDSLVCHLCNTTFVTESEALQHESSCPSACPAPACPLSFPSRGLLRAHVASHPTVCAVCLRTFANVTERDAHALRHRLAKRYVCGYDGCILRFTHRSSLLAHIRKCHARSPSPAPAPAAPAPTAPAHAVACPQCPRTFASLAAMRCHARVHRERAQENATGVDTDEDGNKVEYLDLETLEDEH